MALVDLPGDGWGQCVDLNITSIWEATVVAADRMETGALDITDADFPRYANRIAMKRLGTPDDLGMAALYLVAPASSWVTGQVLNISGGPI